ncbi:MAG: hypothetical protein KDA25_04120 [Phycisphaerales bacterium]|nr:hypothetical protein [Phycisphaerales bacterium]
MRSEYTFFKVGRLAAITAAVALAAVAGANPPCGEPDAGDCNSANGTPGCDNLDCCKAVCGEDPFCCDTEWDDVCAGEAATLCGGPTCILDCPPGSSEELEVCGDDTNGGCNGTPVAFGAIDCGETVCGTGWADGGTRDTDWYLISVTGECTTITADLTSQFSGVVFIVGGIDVCAPVVLGTTGASAECVSNGAASADVAAGDYVVFVAPSVFEGVPCGAGNDYVVTVSCEECVPVEGCELECPPNASLEGETCGDDTNGGCNSTPVAFGSIECGETICGTGWADGGTRDTDWYLLDLTGETDPVDLTATLTSEFSGVVFIVGGIANCAPAVLGQTGSSVNCEAVQPAVATVAPGQYVIFVAAADFNGTPCDTFNDYTVTLQCGDAPPPCDIVCDGSAEGETCGDDTNGGCNSTPVAFGSIECGETICGTSYADAGTRDTDWYLLDLATDETISAELISEFPGVVFIIGGIDVCAPVVLGDIGTSANCEAGASATADLTAGQYVIFVSAGNADGSGIFEGYPCGGNNDYSLTLTCGTGGCPCAWDLDGDCDVDPADLAILLAAWNSPYGPADLAALLAEWGCSG